MPDACYGDRRICKRRYSRKGYGLVGAGMHIRFHAPQPSVFRSLQCDSLCRLVQAAAHPFQNPQELHISLQRAKMYAGHQHLDPRIAAIP